jgi:hypothetical protein
MATLQDVNLNNLVVATINLQFVFFGWRLVREIAVGDKNEKGTSWRTWLPWPDRINLVSLFLVTAACVITPIIMGRFTAASRAILVGAVILWMLHPLSVACHYELLRGGRRKVYNGGPEKWPLATPTEAGVLTVSVLVAVVVASSVWCMLAK